MQKRVTDTLVGAAPAFQGSVRLIERMAECDVTVLIQGETGTGKELAARAVHYMGSRRNYPFVPVNCGAIPDNLLENELFGHVRGAFTDAREAQSGLVANAEGGTLFLDEVECLSGRGQMVLLRFLQDCVYRPLGSDRQHRGNVRVIAASNADLDEMVEAGAFRQDLLYRMTVVTIHLPALRERPGDVLLLARHFVRRFSGEYEIPEPVLSVDDVDALLSHDWPGNVRELENVIHRACLMAEGGELRVELPAREAPVAREDGILAHPPVTLGFQRAKAMVVAEFEKGFLIRALRETGGNVSAAARLTGKERRAFGKLLKKHGISPA